MNTRTDAGAIFGIGLAFFGAKALLSAVELGVFGALRGGPLSLDELVRALGLHSRGARDFFDALVALGLLGRSDGKYVNTPQADLYLVPDSPSYIGGALELANARLYGVWAHLSEALRTGGAQNEAKSEGDYYANLSGDQPRLHTFLRGMTGLSMMASRAIAEKFPWAQYKTFVDVGGAQGALSVELALKHAHLEGATFDLPAVKPFFDDYVASHELCQRLHFCAGDFFSDPLPSAEVLIMGHVLHNWDLGQKRLLIQKAYDALPRNGILLVYEALIDDERKEHAFGLLMSLNMLLVTSGGFVFTGSDCCSWMRDAHFRETRVEHLNGPDWMVVGIK